MADPFENSLREMLNSNSAHDDDACLHRVLKTANRQVGAGDLFALVGHWLQALLLGVSRGSQHLAPVTRRASPTRNSQEG